MQQTLSPWPPGVIDPVPACVPSIKSTEAQAIGNFSPTQPALCSPVQVAARFFGLCLVIFREAFFGPYGRSAPIYPVDCFLQMGQVTLVP